MKQSKQNDRDEKKSKQKPDGKSADGRLSGVNDKRGSEDTQSLGGKTGKNQQRNGQER